MNDWSRYWIRRTISFAAAAAVLLCIASCGKKDTRRPSAGPAQVEVYVTEQQTIPATIEHIGQVQASQTVDVRARVAGVILQQGFEEGTTVSEGQFLFRIDPRPFEANLAIAEAKLVQSQVGAQSEQRNLNRTQNLAKTNNVSREELEDAQTKYATARAGLQLAEADRYKAQLELSYTTVTAPIAGKIGQALKRPGDLVDTANNSLLCTITRQEPAWVEFFVSEREMLNVKNEIDSGDMVLPADGKLRVGVTLLDGTPYPSEGEISFFDVKIDPQTGTALVRAELPNPQGLLVPGQFVEVHVRGFQRPAQVMVPQSAVQIGMQGQYVLVVGPENKVEMRPIAAADWQGHGWVIESGLAAGEQVVTGGITKARPGSTVDVTTVTRTLQPGALAPVTTTGNDQRTNGRKPVRTNGTTTASATDIFYPNTIRIGSPTTSPAARQTTTTATPAKGR